MNTIFNYVESIFINLPRTPDMEHLKEDMLLNMEEKYHHLKEQGISENEAIGTVLSEFGNIDEIIEEYELSMEEKIQNDPDVIEMNATDVEQYTMHRQQFSLAMAIGAFLCTIAVAVMFMVSGIGQGLFGLSEDMATIIGVAFMLLLIAVSVGIFIVFGMKESNYPFDKKILKVDTLTFSRIKADYDQFKPRFGYAIAAGVVMCILGPISLLLSIVLLGEGDMLNIVFLMSFIATGVFIFVYYGVQNDTYEKLLTMGSHTREKVKANKLTELVSSIVFPLAALYYVFQGFIFDNWGTAWVVFPIVGISFGIFAAITEAVANTREKR